MKLSALGFIFRYQKLTLQCPLISISHKLDPHTINRHQSRLTPTDLKKQYTTCMRVGLSCTRAFFALSLFSRQIVLVRGSSTSRTCIVIYCFLTCKNQFGMFIQCVRRLQVTHIFNLQCVKCQICALSEESLSILLKINIRDQFCLLRNLV